MRAQTPSFVVSVKLLLPRQIQNHLEKSFHIANSAYNEALGFGLRRFNAMKRKSFLSRTVGASSRAPCKKRQRTEKQRVQGSKERD